MYVSICMLITDLVSFRSGSIILDTGLSFEVLREDQWRALAGP